MKGKMIEKNEKKSAKRSKSKILKKCHLSGRYRQQTRKRLRKNIGELKWNKSIKKLWGEKPVLGSRRIGNIVFERILTNSPSGRG